ncbi:MAG: hypothetical protein Q8L64_03565 [bacterium]|nr:hypothetical protein [bacterium]
MKKHIRPLIAIAGILCIGLTAAAQTTVDTPSIEKSVATETVKTPAIEGIEITDYVATIENLTIRLAWTELTDQTVIDQRIVQAGYVRATAEQMAKAFGEQQVMPRTPSQQSIGLIIANTDGVAKTKIASQATVTTDGATGTPGS